MADDNTKYRIFEVRSCEADLEPTSRDASSPSYFRVTRDEVGPLDMFDRPEFWAGGEWQPSVYSTLAACIDDVLGSGAFVREMSSDEKGPWHA